ncbi:MAG: EpsG family protein [Bacilli bacterium]
MLQIVYLCLILLSCTLSLKNSFFKKISLFLVIGYFVILSGGNLTNNDAKIYSDIFETSKYAFFTKDIGYGFLLNIAHGMDLSLSTFRFLEYFIGILLIHFGVKKIAGKNEIIFFVLYLIYPFLLDVIETRNFLALSVLIFSIQFFLKKGMGRKLFFILLFALSCTLHKIMVIYIPCFLLFLIPTKSKNIRKAIYMLFFMCCVIGVQRDVVSNVLLSVEHIVGHIPGIDRNLRVDNENGWIVTYFSTISFFIAANLIYSEFLKLANSNVIKKDSFIFKSAKLIFVLSIWSCMFIPFYAVSADYMRVSRNMIPLSIASFACLLSYKSFKFKNILVHKINKCDMAICFVVAMQLVEISSIFYSNLQSALIYDTFVNNTIFNFFII